MSEIGNAFDTDDKSYIKARVIGNYGDPGLDNDAYCDIKSRFVVAIKNEDKMPFVLKPGRADKIEPSNIGVSTWPEGFNTSLLRQNNIILVKTPPATWINIDPKASNPVKIKNGDYSELVRFDNDKRKNVGASDAFTLEEIPRLNNPYRIGEEIKIQKLSQEKDKETKGSNSFISDFPLIFNLPPPLFNEKGGIGILPNGCYGGENEYDESYPVLPNIVKPKYDPVTKSFTKPISTFYAGGKGTYFFIAYGQHLYEDAIKYLLESSESKSTLRGLNINNVIECWRPNGSKIPTNYDYAFNRLFSSVSSFAGSLGRLQDKCKILSKGAYQDSALAIYDTNLESSSNFCVFSACCYEEVNDNRKREADSSCIPNVIVSPTAFGTPSERKTSLIDFSITIPQGLDGGDSDDEFPI